VDTGSRPARILAVDDEEDVQALLIDALTENGYQVRLAPDAEQALELLRFEPFDLVLTDLKMPGMDGITLSSILSQTHPGLPVVLLTGYAQVELARDALRHGASDFVTKPFTLESLAIVIARNLERLRMERQRVLEQADKIMFQTVQTLAAAISAKERGTGQHSRRAAFLAEVLGQEIGLDPQDLRCLELATHIHDVGKIGVPDDILNKPGPLDAEEWVVMRSHPVIGAEIVGQVDELAYVADIVRHHHERIDGHGYPDGLRGDSIPLLSRIISIVDAYECMTSDRVYRSRLPVAEAIRRLEEASGTQFDASLVAVFLHLHQEGKVE
jgi:putative two-component system response regulator